jgi:hypothetical protein
MTRKLSPACRPQDLTGQQFTYLTVLRHAGSHPKGGALWLCRCQCGHERIYAARTLKYGHTTSCGCLTMAKIGKTHDLTGRQFADLTALHPAGSAPYGGARWLCQCQCGCKIVRLAKSLITGAARSCGCQRGWHTFKHGHCACTAAGTLAPEVPVPRSLEYVQPYRRKSC